MNAATLLKRLLILLLEITLMMDPSAYQVDEDDGFVNVRVRVTGETAVDIGSR